MRTIIIAIVVVVALLLVPGAALAGTLVPASVYGRDYGQHHAQMARDMGGFSGSMNPGVHHQGFSGWDPDMVMP